MVWFIPYISKLAISFSAWRDFSQINFVKRKKKNWGKWIAKCFQHLTNLAFHTATSATTNYNCKFSSIVLYPVKETSFLSFKEAKQLSKRREN